MPVPDERNEPAGTVYGGRRPSRPGLPQDPLMRTALVTGLVGVLLGVFFATGVLGGGDESVLPASASTGAASTPTQPAAATSAPAATTPAAPSPTPVPTTPPAPTAPAAGPKVFQAVVSGLCLGLDGDGEKAQAQLAACTGGPEQQWVANPLAPDLVTLANAAYGQCLDVEGGGADDGAKLQQFPCHGQANQQWRLTPVGTGPVLLVSVQSGRCAQVKDAGTKPGDRIVQTTCTGAAEQQWTVA